MNPLIVLMVNIILYIILLKVAVYKGIGGAPIN